MIVLNYTSCCHGNCYLRRVAIIATFCEMGPWTERLQMCHTTLSFKKKHHFFRAIHIKIPSINPYLNSGGGVNLTPPLHEIRDCVATAADRDTPFYDFFLSSLTHLLIPSLRKSGPSVARSRNFLYSHVGSKFAQNPHFAYVCVQNTWKLLIFF